MKRPTKQDLQLFGAQAAVWAFILLLPPLTAYLSTHDWANTVTFEQMVWTMLRSPLILYFVNFYLLVPHLFFKQRTWLFALCNLLLMATINFGFFFMKDYMPDMPANAWIGFYTGIFVYFLLNCTVIAAALGLRHFIRTRQIRQQLQEEKAKHTEAELAWLKSQINPHFLFNTLNNISSLTQMDAEAAQDAIAQLSDLLRYAMYETDKPLVSIGGEMEFMRNYVELMKLRCNEKTSVSCTLEVTNQQIEIAPLLFISLIENAFKHGADSNTPSFIRISLREENGQIIFTCDNTNHPKTATDRSGSGIGLDNTRRRLELLYEGRYEWEQSITPEGVYHLKITLQA